MYILHSQQAYVKYLENESVKTLEGGLCQINSNVLSEVHLCNSLKTSGIPISFSSSTGSVMVTPKGCHGVKMAPRNLRND